MQREPAHSTRVPATLQRGQIPSEFPRLDPETRNLWSPPPPLLERLSQVPDAPGLQLWEGREPRGGGHCGNRAVRVKTYFKLCSVVVFLLKTQAVK